MVTPCCRAKHDLDRETPSTWSLFRSAAFTNRRALKYQRRQMLPDPPDRHVNTCASGARSGRTSRTSMARQVQPVTEITDRFRPTLNSLGKIGFVSPDYCPPCSSLETKADCSVAPYRSSRRKQRMSRPVLTACASATFEGAPRPATVLVDELDIG